MSKKAIDSKQEDVRRSPPSTTLEQRENQLIALAVDLAEKQLREGTASSQVIAHYLKLGSTKEKYEKEILKEKKKLLEAKTDAIQSSKRIEDLYSKAVKAMKAYAYSVDDEDDNE